MKNHLLIVALALITVAVTSCKEKNRGGTIPAFNIDPDFNIYGYWERADISPSSFAGLTGSSWISIEPDKIVGIFYEDHGIMTQTDTYQFNVMAEYKPDEHDTLVLIYDPITKLLKRTNDEIYFKKKPDGYSPSHADALPFYIEHNNQTIDIAVFYSHDADGEFFMHKIDSLRFGHNGKIHTVKVDMGSQIFGSEDEPNFRLILLDDFNFDGYIDVAVLSNRGVSNEAYNYFIYNPQTQSYHRSEVLSGLMNASFDKETKTVKAHNSSGAGMYYEGETYKWNGDKLTLIQSVKQAPNEDDVLIRTTRTLQDGEWVEQTDTVDTQ
ncbi:MAG: hypothetical protein LBU89_10675 [Fibromonadaceae bacterium]|nr:hypothetical protein [Fibromonadaceae bacterium]